MFDCIEAYCSWDRSNSIRRASKAEWGEAVGKLNKKKQKQKKMCNKKTKLKKAENAKRNTTKSSKYNAKKCVNVKNKRKNSGSFLLYYVWYSILFYK
jgi:hypothetical protein